MFYQYEELTEIPCCDNVFKSWTRMVTKLKSTGKKVVIREDNPGFFSSIDCMQRITVIIIYK